MDATIGDERRFFTRIPINRHIVLDCGNRQWTTELIDISLKGALFRCPDGYEARIGEVCSIELPLQPRITMQGTIAHCQNAEIGFHCKRIDLDSIAHLRRLVELHLADEALLERELAELAGAAD